MTLPRVAPLGASNLSQRCERIRESVALEQLFELRGWDYTPGRRIRCLWPDHDDHTPDMQLYPDTDSVHCFACNRSGDVIELVRHCVPSRGVWSVEQAVSWLERAFELAPLTAPESLRRRLRRSFAEPANPVAAASAERMAAVKMVHAAFDAVEHNVPPIVAAAVGGQRESIWQSGEGPEVDLIAWATQARAMIYGSYANRIVSLRENIDDLATSAPDVLDVLWDDAMNVDAAWHWETHRGIDMESPWPVCVPGL